ncbi:MAG: cytochrome c family protein [Deltaproteobacteria bacterium]|jgi:hypothetical protein|nr:cytochrome c family protein [Deltaproteobacteria bacterium]
MLSEKRLKIVYGLIIYLLLVGVLCYAAFPEKSPVEPVRKTYNVVAGKVLFDHQAHASELHYGLSCYDCHHHPIDDDSSLIACGDCHYATEEANGLPDKCLECHDADEVEGTEILKRSDAFHEQCINCHQNFDAGPVACTACHTTY